MKKEKKCIQESCSCHGCGYHENERGEAGKLKIILLAAGIILLAAGIIIQNFLEINKYITLAVFILSYALLGGGVLLKALKNITRGKIFDENFLMSIATIGAFAIGEYAEAAAVMLFYQIGEFLQELAVSRAKKSISRLMDIRPDYANLKKDSEIIKVAPDTVKTGDIIIVKPGEKVPLDGVIIEGGSLLDTAALTGESVPRKVSVNDTVLSGSVNTSGVLTIKVTQTYGESTVSKIIKLAENAVEKKAPTENFITKFARYYTPAVVGLATLLAVIPPLLFNGVWIEWISRALIFLVISCPCALVISIPLGFFGGIGGAAKQGVLIKGGNYLEALTKLDTVVFDKTGTLTNGVFKVKAIEPANGFDEKTLLEAAAAAEAFSNHPIACAIREYSANYELRIANCELKSGANGVGRDGHGAPNYGTYTEIAGRGVSAKVDGKTILAGNQKLMEENGVNLNYELRIANYESGTTVHIAIDGVYAGRITVSDEIKPDSAETVKALKERGIRVVMLTGDKPEIAKAVAAELGIDEFYAGLLPHEKVEKVKQLKNYELRITNYELRNGVASRSKKLLFIGDGINDAPVIALSDVGAAMGGLGSDAAIEAADVVIMNDNPYKLISAVKTAKFTKKIIWQNIMLAFIIKAVFLTLGAFGIASMWEAVFADVGAALLAVFNSLRAMKTGN